eukprot:7641640-Pyramimonas_sp.AAC.1
MLAAALSAAFLLQRGPFDRGPEGGVLSGGVLGPSRASVGARAWPGGQERPGRPQDTSGDFGRAPF